MANLLGSHKCCGEGGWCHSYGFVWTCGWSFVFWKKIAKKKVLKKPTHPCATRATQPALPHYTARPASLRKARCARRQRSRHHVYR
jgi:hypothetical protein